MKWNGMEWNEWMNEDSNINSFDPADLVTEMLYSVAVSHVKSEGIPTQNRNNNPTAAITAWKPPLKLSTMQAPPICGAEEQLDYQP